MKVRTHKFKQNGMHVLVDVNSGAVHVIDEMIYDMMDDFDGTNDEARLDARRWTSSSMGAVRGSTARSTFLAANRS